MDKAYWNLFWTTGMPEAWLMSRDRTAPYRTRNSAFPEERQAPSGPLVGIHPRSDDSLGGPMGLY